MSVMRHFRALPVILALLVPGMTPAAISDQPARPALPQPSTEREPADVVRIVIEALANNDEPFADAGIATTFAFASPSNKVNTGPLSKFTQMVKNPTYGIMVDHVEHEFSEVVQTDGQAYQMVRIKGASGAQVIFAFRLSLQRDGEFAGMWMTDAVWPVATHQGSGQAF